MGQISLPRLEKINSTMIWESSILYNTERWAGLKFLIFFRLLINHIFFFQYFSFKKKWKISKKLYFKKISKKFLVKTFKKKKLRKLFFKKSQSNSSKFKLLCNYIYQYNNNYYSLILYSSYKSRREQYYIFSI
jgi:hypothetical protein